MHGFAVSCCVSRREIRSDWCSSWHGIEAGLSIMAMRFDDRTGQSGVLRISFTPPEGSLRARCGPACEWDAAQEARRVATPMRVQLPRNGIMRALYRRICTAGGDWALIGDVGMRLVAITVREKRLCEKWESHDMNGVPMKHDGADAPRGACAIIRMVRVRSASGREGLVVRLGVCL